MAKESDWVSVANYNERSHLKNTLSYEFFRRSGAWAPHTMYCELIINNEYQGLYTFTERIKRDKNRVDIKKLDEDDDSPYDITGGYLIVNNDNDQADDGW
ncbi:MAG: CotH kinase family protein, partial [Spirosomataceae bacterium]